MFANISIKHKLMTVVTGVAVVAVGLTCTAFLIMELNALRNSMMNEMTTLAEITASNCQASVYFEDNDAARETLEALRANSEVIVARVYSSDGEVFAEYYDSNRAVNVKLPEPLKPDARVEKGYIHVFRPIVVEGKTVGLCYLLGDLDGPRDRRLSYSLTTAVIIALVGILVAFILAARLQQLISQPILHLLDVSAKVAENDAGSRPRAQKFSDDEIGRLTDGFNTMLDEIQRREQEAARHGEQLEETVTARTAELRALNEELKTARDRAEEANRTKSDFLANTSHEIRTPMNAVIGLTELALRTELTIKQRDYMNKIKISARNLLEIINDILDFSKIEAGMLEMEEIPFDLDEVMENLVNLMGPRCNEKDLELLLRISPETPQAMIGDPLRLGQVLTNLVSNAVKFTNHGSIIIQIQPQSQEEDRIELGFRVTDTGIGIEAAKKEALFDSFAQADGSTTREYGGTGLGLAICRQLVTLMDGEIGVESKLGEGSTFHFTARFQLRPEPARRSLTASHGKRVLIIDDHATAREIIGDTLEQFNFKVCRAASGSQALDLIRHNNGTDYDLVIVDWHMPGMDGIDTIRRIREITSEHGGPAVLMITAYGRESVSRQAANIGVDGFLIKPIRPSVLLDAVMDIFDPTENRSPRVMQAKQKPTFPKLVGGRILLAEDNPTNRQVACEFLQAFGLQVTVKPNGLEAFAELCDHRDQYDLMLMDLQMPVMDGYEASRRIRNWERGRTEADPKYTPLPIIAMTAHTMSGDREKCLAAGMNDHTPKPIDPDQLPVTLERWIQTVPDAAVLKEAAPPPPPQQVEPIDLPDRLPGLDIRDGLRKVMGNKGLYVRVVRQFSQDNSDLGNRIRAAHEAGDQEAAAALVHALKGGSGNIGAMDLFREATRLEGRLHHGDADRKDYKTLSTVLSVVLDSIRFLTANIKTAPAQIKPETEVDLDTARRLISEMTGLIKNQSLDVDACMNAMESSLYRADTSDLLVRLRGMIDTFDFENAPDLVAKIADTLGVANDQTG